jgi:hypothetical protein
MSPVNALDYISLRPILLVSHLCHNFHTDPGAHPGSPRVGSGVDFIRGKLAPSEDNYLVLSSDEVKNGGAIHRHLMHLPCIVLSFLSTGTTLLLGRTNNLT